MDAPLVTDITFVVEPCHSPTDILGAAAPHLSSASHSTLKLKLHHVLDEFSPPDGALATLSSYTGANNTNEPNSTISLGMGLKQEEWGYNENVFN